MKEAIAKFRLLLWKNYKLQLRHPIQTLFEIFVPVFFCVILVVVRSLVESDEVKNTITYPTFDPRINESDPSRSFPGFTKLVYSPKNDDVEKIMQTVATHFSGVPLSQVENADLLEKYLVSQNDKRSIGIQFPDSYAKLSHIPDVVEVSFRFPSELTRSKINITVDTWKTNLLYPIFQEAGPREMKQGQMYTASPYYYQERFLDLQAAISEAIIKLKDPTIAIPQVLMRRFPYPPFHSDPLMVVLREMISLIFVLAFEYTAISIIKIITAEKEKQLKESMKIMGLPGWLHWTAWFVKSFLFVMISISIMVALLKINGWYEDNIPAVLPKVNTFLFLLFLILFAISTITLCFAISVFFSKANMAAGIGGVLFFLFLVPYTVLRNSYEDLTLSSKLAASLMSNTAMAYGFQIICTFEMAGDGLQFNNFFKPVSPDDDLTMAHIFLMLIIDTLIYLSITLYVEAIFPGPYGVAKPWHFIFTWPFKKDNAITVDIVGDPLDPTRYEESPKSRKAGIDIKGLTKVYNKKVAVNNMQLKMFEDQITVLLGHNGAGKTTTMSMLTGMENPSMGTALINGYDLRKEMKKVRASLGLCPQHNILFDELTVAEHIYFYSRLKGMPSNKIKYEIDEFLKLLELTDKRNKQSKTLSGGMKRKLSVAVAFCGGSKVVMLDEPTAGMDPAARRALWELVESQKSGRTIMLTTHFMDEADLLGDRIAIMAAGELQCCGSSFFLKKRYGAGYHLIIDKLPQCNSDKITDTLRLFIPHVQVESNIGSELTYCLNESDSAHFESMLSNLEENMSELGIGSYGISLTTLEEVFMKVGADNTLNMLKNNNNETSKSATTNGTRKYAKHTSVTINEGSLLTGTKLFKNQVWAMFLKRVLSTLRSWPLLLTQLLIPILLLIFAILSGRQSNQKELPKLPIRLNAYTNTVTLLQGGDSPYKEAAKEWLSSKGLATKSVDSIAETILQLRKDKPATVHRSYIIAGEFIKKDTIVGWFNNDPLHSPPLMLNFIYNSIFRSISKNYEIIVNNYPLPLRIESNFKLLQQGNNMGFQLAVNIGFCMTFVSAFYILFYVRERMCKAKHLQFVSGVNLMTFWLVSYAWDWFTYVLTLVALIVTLLCFQENGFKSGSEIGKLIVIFIYFGIGVLPMIYLLSFLYALPSTGFTRVILFSTVLGTFAFMVVEILSVETLDLVDVANVLNWIFLLVPHYSLANGIRNSDLEYQRYNICNKFVEVCVETSKLSAEECRRQLLTLRPGLEGLYHPECSEANENYYVWKKPGIGRNILFTVVIGLILSMIVIMIEYKFFNRILYALQSKKSTYDYKVTDDDVQQEIEKVRNMDESAIKKYSLVVRDLKKFYKNFPAVKGLCLTVNEYECFGLLGVNGAGKTTSFKMITGDTDISSGDVFVQGINLKYNIKEVYKRIGYCPQFDALFDDLTARETITVFALLRGIPYVECSALADNLAKEFDFWQHVDKKVREMSGGNKRKLSTAVALIGDPPIIYLDEPTTGMDPATKRHLWNALCKLRDQGKCLILTTHSMEESEALCTRLAIMVNGQFKCLGSTQHLKNKFARGFTLTIKVKKHENFLETINTVNQFIQEQFPSAELHEQYQEMISFYIPNCGLPWSKMFGIMERSKGEIGIEDYALGQSSLEQVFLKFTQQQI